MGRMLAARTRGGVWRGMAAAVGALVLISPASALAQQASPAPPVVDTDARFPGIVNTDSQYSAALGQRRALLTALRPVSDPMLASPPAEDWLMWRRTYDGLGFSPLRVINKANAAHLGVAWTWSLPISPDEITPLVHDGVIFINSANRVQALDGATGDLLWQYVRPMAPAVAAQAVARNMALYEDKLFVPTRDRHVVALDIKTGKVVWDHEVIAAADVGPQLSGGPMAAKGKVIQGVTSCNTYKGGCFIVALDAQTGAEAWRFYTLARPGEPGGDSWNGAPLQERFGGAVWTSGTYDPALNLVYFGTGQTYDTATLLMPHAEKGQSADALYTDSTLALNPDTGRLAWSYQHFNRDVWDFDWVFERTLIDLPIAGVTRKVSVTAGKIAIIDVLDRTNGQYLFSKDLGLQNLVNAIDPLTGRKTIDPALTPEANVVKTVCPHPGGARAWPATAYNPVTGILYAPLVESCMNFTWAPHEAAQTAAGGNDMKWVLKPRADSDGKFGRVEAINLKTGKVVWTQRRRAPEVSSIVATAGGLIFEGSRDRMFRASDDQTGKVLWQTRLNAAPSSTPITYSVGGEQYVAVVAGGGGPHEITWATLTPELSGAAPGTTLWVFKLPR